jgi:hypothetical protein
LPRCDEQIQRWRDITARNDPDDCAAGIAELYGKWQAVLTEAATLTDEHDKLVAKLADTMPIGWRCPVCMSVYAPSCMECFRCNAKRHQPHPQQQPPSSGDPMPLLPTSICGHPHG